MANGRVSVRPSSVSSASSIVPIWLKSCGRHSLMRDRFSTDIRRNGRRNASTPYGLRSAAASAASANVAHARAAKRRAPTGASVTASSANGPIRMRPKMNPPCMFTHAVMSAASPSGGARPRSRAAISPAPQAAASGSASTCGRASRFAVTSERPIATVAMSGDAAKFTRRAQSDDQRRDRNGGASQQYDAAPSAEAKGERQQNFRQPFVRGPRLSRHRMAERIDARRAPMSDDPLARRHMRPRVAVAKHVGREGGEREQKERDCSEA